MCNRRGAQCAPTALSTERGSTLCSPTITFFTKDLYKTAAKAQNRLALPTSPSLRVEFQILNNPTLLRNGTKVLPTYGMMGKGSEFMTLDFVKVKIINWQPLK